MRSLAAIHTAETAIEAKRAEAQEHCRTRGGWRPDERDWAAVNGPAAREELAKAKWAFMLAGGTTGRKGSWSGNHRARLVTFGLGGHGVEYAERGHHLSGYARPENWDARDACVTIHDGKIESVTNYAGTLVVDGRAMFERDPALAFSLPMFSGHLEGTQADRFDARHQDLLEHMAADPRTGMFGDIARLALASPTYGGLDEVSPETYVEMVRPLGARIGRINDEGRIDWEEAP